MAAKETEKLIQHCKTEIKKLLELAVSKQAVYWEHPTFSSFCVSVEDILSYHIKCRIARNTPSRSLRILQELSASSSEARDVHTKVCEPVDPNSEDFYACIRPSFPVDKKILWIRVALLEGKLEAILEALAAKCRLYYKTTSVLCHPEFCPIFLILLAGPCSIRYNIRYGYIISSHQYELIDRHLKLLSVSPDENSINGLATPSTDRAWHHLKALHQSSSSLCVFGKNNILLKPVGMKSPLAGYLTLQLTSGGRLELRWIPNCLLGTSAHVKIGLWDHVIAVDLIQDISHIHIHKTQGHKTQGSIIEVILIGIDGIPLPTLLFPQLPSLITFLECLDRSCFSQSCIDPPLSHVRESMSVLSCNLIPTCLSNYARCMMVPCDSFTLCCASEQSLSETGNWKLVFRVRYVYEKDVSLKKKVHVRNHSIGFQKWTVVWHLKARFFHKWLSHCRYVRKVREKLSHLILPTPVPPVNDEVVDRQGRLSKKEWLDFRHLSPANRKVEWKHILTTVYLVGIEKHIRSEVWPYLLGVFPVTSTETEKVEIVSKLSIKYRELTQAWKRVEMIHRKQKLSAEYNGSSPSLSVISPSPSCDDDDDKNIICVQDETENVASPSSLQNAIDKVFVQSKDVFDFVHPNSELDEEGETFIKELETIDKDVPRCDRDYWYFKSTDNLLKLRAIVTTYVWENLSEGYSQGMCDLLAPLLVVLDDEILTYACFVRLMEQTENFGTRINNVQALLQVLEPHYYNHLTQHLVDSDGRDLLCMYCFRWLMVSFKREFSFEHLFDIWESVWSARQVISQHMEEFIALAMFLQFKSAVLDAHLSPSDVLSLLNSHSDRLEIDSDETLRISKMMINKLWHDLSKQ